MLITLICGGILTGCRLPNRCCDACVPDSGFLSKNSLASVSIQEVQPIRIPYLPEQEEGIPPDGIERIYPLTIRECEWMASQHSPLAAVIDTELMATDACPDCSQVDPCIRESIADTLAANAMYQRNLTSEKALLAYLGLVEVYLQNQIIAETLSEIDDLKDVLTQLQEDDLLKQVDKELLNRQKLATLSRQNELLFNFEKLNSNLRALLGLEEATHPIWTDCQIDGWKLPTDLEEEYQIACENRSDLGTIEQLANTSDDKLLETLRSSVRESSPLAGLVIKRRLFGGFFADHTAELSKLRSQLRILNSAQMDLVRTQISEHFYSIFRSHQQIKLDLQRLESLRKSEARLTAKRQVGSIRVEDVLTLKSDILESRSKIISSTIDLQRSWIRLKATQGLLGHQQEIDK